jgi:hypothetical protein
MDTIGPLYNGLTPRLVETELWEKREPVNEATG